MSGIRCIQLIINNPTYYVENVRDLMLYIDSTYNLRPCTLFEIAVDYTFSRLSAGANNTLVNQEFIMDTLLKGYKITPYESIVLSISSLITLLSVALERDILYALNCNVNKFTVIEYQFCTMYDNNNDVINGQTLMIELGFMRSEI